MEGGKAKRISLVKYNYRQYHTTPSEGLQSDEIIRVMVYMAWFLPRFNPVKS
jgi:hypothetical protein